MSEVGSVTAAAFEPSDAAAAERYAERLRPKGGAVHLLVVVDVDAPGDWSTRALITLADAIAAAAAGSVVVADLAFEQPMLAAPLAVDTDEGLTDVLLYGASVDRVRVTPHGHAFDLITTGFVAAEPAELLRHPRWQNFIDTIGTEGGRLLAAVPADAAAIGGLLRRASVVFLGPDESARRWRARWPAADVRLMLRPEPPVPTPAAAPTAAPAEGQPAGRAATASASGTPGAQSTRASTAATATREAEAAPRDWRRGVVIALAVVVVVSLIAALWYFGRDWFGGDDPANTVLEATVPTTAPVPLYTGATPATLAAVQPAGTPLPYSVAVEAHDNLPMASRRVAALRAAQPSMGFFTAPILVDSTLYYRVMAGPLADDSAAQRAVQALLAGGQKTGVSEWDVRSTPYAFLIGEYEQSEQADARMRELESLDIPSYVVEVPYADGPPKYYLYSGAYAGPAEADVMRSLLRSAGLPDTLVQRIGRSPNGPPNGPP